jgi:ribosomal protein S18 acetylase RimI-like enzyme
MASPMTRGPVVTTIHRANVEDIPAIKAVLAATWRDTYSSLLSEAALAKVANEWHSPQVLEAEIGRATAYSGVAKNDSNEVVAMITASSLDDLLSIHRLYVLPSAQRQGIGSRLLKASLQAFPQTKRIRLEVEELNHKGRSFYLKQGFGDLHSQMDQIAGVALRSVTMEKVL